MYNYDSLKSNEELWDLFVKKEEYNPEFLDEHQRFPHYLSKHRNVFEPIVSTYLVRSGLKIDYPREKKFAVCLTHDIDSVYFPIIGIGNEILQTLLNAKLGKAGKMAITNSGRLLLSPFDKSKNPAHNFEEIINLEKKYGAKSSFYFLQSDKHDGNRFIGCNIDRLKDELRIITENGWEVGLHGGYDTYIDQDRIKREKDKLENAAGKKVIGYRNHFLRFKIADTWELLKTAGFKYDTTFGYTDCVGFRNGMCHPFKPFNLNTGKYIDIWEIPLTIMDKTLLNYMQLDEATSWEVAKRLIDTVEEHNGVITILWHNTSMRGAKGEFYERMLQYCYEKNAWMTSAEDIWMNVSGENDR